MKFIIRHEIRGRLRLHIWQRQMSMRDADILSFYLSNLKGVTAVKVYDRTADAVSAIREIGQIFFQQYRSLPIRIRSCGSWYRKTAEES